MDKNEGQGDLEALTELWTDFDQLIEIYRSELTPRQFAEAMISYTVETYYKSGASHQNMSEMLMNGAMKGHAYYVMDKKLTTPKGEKS